MAGTRGETSARALPPARRLIHVLNYDDLLAATTASFAIDGRLPLTVGRAVDGPPRITGNRLEAGDAWLSTEHAVLVAEGDGVAIHDQGSRNGVWVNGVRVGAQRLEDGDLLELGHGLWSFQVAAAEQLTLLEARPGGVFLGPTRTFCPEIAGLVADLERIAPSAQPVLVIAETGSGKELLSQAVHTLSNRKGALVAVDCGAVPETLFESTFFGHRKGAFTGAGDARVGEFVRADEGTLFLDEVGNIAPASQAKLLRVLEDGRVHPLGANEAVRVDVRIVAATNRELFGGGGPLRTDLLQRLAGYVARLPPLRHRREDLGELTRFLLTEGGVKKASITGAAARQLFTGPFEGNIRELRATLRTAGLLAGDGPIDLGHLPVLPARAAPAPSVPPRPGVPTQPELEAALAATGGNVVHAAQRLGAHPRQVYRWIDKLGIDLARFR